MSISTCILYRQVVQVKVIRNTLLNPVSLRPFADPLLTAQYIVSQGWIGTVTLTLYHRYLCLVGGTGILRICCFAHLPARPARKTPLAHSRFQILPFESVQNNLNFEGAFFLIAVHELHARLQRGC